MTFSSKTAKVLFWVAVSLILAGGITGVAYKFVKTDADPEIPVQVVATDSTSVVDAPVTADSVVLE
jgi:hypothetical protein